MAITRLRTILVASVGNCLEWYDFGLYGYFATVIASLFFPAQDRLASLLATFGVFALGYGALTELMPARVRGTGFATSYNLAASLFGGTAPILATYLIAVSGHKAAPSFTIMVAAVAACVAFLLAPETSCSELQ